MTGEPGRHGWGHPWRMIVTLNTQSLASLDEVRAFPAGNAPVDFAAAAGDGRYAWLARTLTQFRYATLKRAERGLLQDFMRKVTGYSRAQLIRLVRQWLGGRKIVIVAARRRSPTPAAARRRTF